MRKNFILLPIVAAVLAGCNLAPSYERPQAPVEAAWPVDEATKNAKVLTEGLADWADFFTDARLKKLIELGLENNRDLRAAMYNVEKARAQYNVSRADLLPSVAAVASESASRTPQSMSTTGNVQYSHVYSANAAMSSYELDLFGRIRNTNEQALQAYFVTQAAQRTAQMTLISEIASTWLSLGAAKDQLRLSRQTRESQEQSAELINKSYELGSSSLIDVQQVLTTVATAKAAEAQALRSVSQYRNALVMLVGGQVPSDLEPETLPAQVTTAVSAMSNVPSEVLLNRPDIASAEASLKSANANIGVARAAFFPSISLTGTYGTRSTEFNNLFDAGTRFWTWAPQVSLPIFTGGANIANLKAANAAQKAALAQYESAVQSAFREVADALATEGTVEAELKAREELAAATQKSYDLAQERYESGADSYLELLDSQRTNFSAQQNLISTRLSRVNSLITLYKVMGGGSKLSDEPGKGKDGAKEAQ